jgi:CRISPR system Cascade subunit CasB
MSESPKKSGKPVLFVESALRRIHGSEGKKPDTGYTAALKRADNLQTEYQSWEHLANWCDLEKDWQRLPYATIAAALARTTAKTDGTLGIGRALAKSYSGDGKLGNTQDPAKAKLRRLLACKSNIEACEIIRPLLRLITAKGVGLSFSALLKDLLFFNDQTRKKWAKDFYSYSREEA